VKHICKYLFHDYLSENFTHYEVLWSLNVDIMTHTRERLLSDMFKENIKDYILGFFDDIHRISLLKIVY